MKDYLSSVYKGKTVLVTGHTGFKGSWLCLWLNELGAKVIGYALEPKTKNDNYVVSDLKRQIVSIIGDIKDFNKLKGVFGYYEPEITFHLAGQPIVLNSYKEPKETYDVNVGGTVNFLECCRLSEFVKVIVNVTSDKCYKNTGAKRDYIETDPLGGHDPYSSSKGCAELVTRAYSKSFFDGGRFSEFRKVLSSARAGNVIGGGDWSEYRVVTDCVSRLFQNKKIIIRNPQATRPWQHVIEVLYGYLLLAAKMCSGNAIYSGAWNFGPDRESNISVKAFVEKFIEYWGVGDYQIEKHDNKPYEARYLMLDNNKVKQFLAWYPVWSINEKIKLTVDWYKGYITGKEDMYDFNVSQISKFYGKVKNSIELQYAQK